MKKHKHLLEIQIIEIDKALSINEDADVKAILDLHLLALRMLVKELLTEQLN